MVRPAAAASGALERHLRPIRVGSRGAEGCSARDVCISVAKLSTMCSKATRQAGRRGHGRSIQTIPGGESRRALVGWVRQGGREERSAGRTSVPRWIGRDIVESAPVDGSTSSLGGENPSGGALVCPQRPFGGGDSARLAPDSSQLLEAVAAAFPTALPKDEAVDPWEARGTRSRGQIADRQRRRRGCATLAGLSCGPVE